MMEATTDHGQPQDPTNNRRPFGLSVLLVFSFVYNGILLLVMLLGLIYPGIVQTILQQYYKSVYISTGTSFILTLAGTLVFGISFYGLIMMWKMRRRGFYFYTAAQAAMLTTLLLILKSYDWVNIGIAVLVIIIFGLHTPKMK